MIINVAHTKGGVGKSTLSCNLAIEMKIPLIDLDMQKSCLFFNQLREQKYTPLKVYTVEKEEDFNILERYSENPTNHIIIDSGGMDNNFNRLALIYADIIITPIGASQIELFGLDHFCDILKELGIKDGVAHVLLNNINTRSTKDIKQIKELITESFNLPMFDAVIGSKKIFKDAFSEGRSVSEKKAESPSSYELHNVIDELQTIIKERMK